MDDITNFPLTLIDVETRPNLRLLLSFRYSDPSHDYNIMLESGVLYDVVFLHRGVLKKVVGRIIGVSKVYNVETVEYPQRRMEWLIRVDASSTNSSLVVDILSGQIRLLRKYTPHMDEDNTIASGTTTGGITHGDVYDVTIKNPTTDEKGNTNGGDIDNGKVGPKPTPDPTDPTKTIVTPISPITITEGGCTAGKNNSGNDVVVVNGNTTGGTITGGKFVSGNILSHDTDENGNYTHCVISYAVISNSTITGGKTTGGSVIEPKFTNVTVTGGTRTGTDMITHGATVVGDIGTGGYTEGGVNHGGSATGEINGNPYTISGGTSTGGKCTGCTVIGGVVSGGTVVGGAIINATITGGTATGGTTINANITVDGGTISPGTHIDTVNPISAVVVPTAVDPLTPNTPGGSSTAPTDPVIGPTHVTPGTSTRPIGPNTPYNPIDPSNPNNPNPPTYPNGNSTEVYWDGLTIYGSDEGIGSNIKTWDGRPGAWVEK